MRLVKSFDLYIDPKPGVAVFAVTAVPIVPGDRAGGRIQH